MKRIGWTALALLFTLTSCGLARDPRATRAREALHPHPARSRPRRRRLAPRRPY
ncbi:MAG: hypothetical protein M5U11_11990 [Anaerolineales bacterium]|nr:hypothetical protein [Anaerolineales bacterium]